MLRTHEAGTLRADQPARPSPSPAGWPGGAITGEWPSWTSGTPRASSRSWSRDEAAPTACARSTACRSPARSAPDPPATRTPTCHRRDRGHAGAGRRAERGRAAAVPDRRAGSRWARRPGCRYRYLDLRRPAPAAPSGCAARSTGRRATSCSTREFVEIETPTLTRSTPEGARDFLVPARLRPGSWYALAAEPAAVQAAAHGGRDGAVLPDRPLLPRRGLPRRPAAGVHPARHRDELRRPGRRHRASPRRSWPRCGTVGYDVATPIPRMTYADAMARYGSRQAGPALRSRADRLHGRTSRTPRSGSSRRRTSGAVVMPGGAAQPRKHAGRLAGLGQAARRPRTGLRAGRRGRRAGRSGRQEPLRGRARRPGRARRRRRRATASSSPPGRRTRRARCSARLGSRSAAAAG